MISNHFKLRVKNYGTISLYTIDFGATIQQQDNYTMREAVKNCSKALEATIGRFMYYSGHIYGM